MPDSDVTVEYCARRNWIVGSPKTVTEKIEQIYREVGGFGVLLVFGFDYKHKPEAWRHSLDLLKSEVMPQLKHLGAEFEKAAHDSQARCGLASHPALHILREYFRTGVRRR